MVACIRIARAMQWLNPDFETFHTVMVAWETEMFRELDFAHEAANLDEVGANLRAAHIEAIVPRPVKGLVGTRVFAMSYEEGFKVTDEAALAMHSVDREGLMVRIVQVYSQQLFVDGFFNADPHAGNLMVQVRDGRATPVLLDFGMTVRLTHEQRLGYARLAFAAQQMDLSGLQARRDHGLHSISARFDS
jgi:aarF domain-containing kinase